jgi:hypothetical protein
VRCHGSGLPAPEPSAQLLAPSQIKGLYTVERELREQLQDKKMNAAHLQKNAGSAALQYCRRFMHGWRSTRGPFPEAQSWGMP